MSYFTVKYLSERLDYSRESATSWGSTWFALPLRSRRDQPRPNRCRTIYLFYFYFLSATPECLNAFRSLHQVRDMRPLYLNSHLRCWLHEIDTMLKNLSYVRSGVLTKLHYNFYLLCKTKLPSQESISAHLNYCVFKVSVSVYCECSCFTICVCKNATPVRFWSAPYNQNKSRFEN